jgi:hydrogenase nickel incorporation protein HypA/HybF
MHEISLVQGLLQQLRDLAAENKASRILQVTMVIGPLSGVVVDSFRFGYDILAAEDSLFRDAELIVEIPAVTYTCSACGFKEITSGPKPEMCSQCRDQILIPEGGDGLILQQVQME